MEFNASSALITLFKGIFLNKGALLLVGSLLFVIAVIEIVKIIVIRRRNRRIFLDNRDIEGLQKLTPIEFEIYTAELFKVLGYKAKVVGGRGDGGIDVVIEKNGITSYIQCKRYTNGNKVPVNEVRDFYGGITDKLNGGVGYFVTTETFTKDATEFITKKPLKLIDRTKLLEYIRNEKMDIPTTDRVCSECGSKLVNKNGKYGKFLGCSNYPKCSHTESIN